MRKEYNIITKVFIEKVLTLINKTVMNSEKNVAKYLVPE